MSGLFITLEGIDGSGKTTQIEKLKDYFCQKGFSVVCTREPGGTKISEKIRNIIIDAENKEMDNMTEALLYASARAQLTSQVIIPALKDGNVVICDRFVDSSLVYQGIARGIGIDTVLKINKFATCGVMPDITFFLRLNPNIAILRKKEQGELDRIESEKFYFHKRVYDAYVSLAKRYPERIKTVDASKDIDDIFSRMVYFLEKMLSERSF